MKLPRYVRWIALIFCWPTILFAAPMMAADAEGVRIVLHDDPCTLKDVVSNLPGRATWTEKGKTFEGCFGVSGNTVMLYFKEDKTVAAVPVPMFARVVGV